MFAPQWRLSVGASLTVANTAYMQAYFGIDAAQAAASGYRPFAARGGLRDARSSVTLSYQISRDFSLTGAVTTTTLGGDAADSPLTRKKQSASGLLALSHAF